MEPISLAAAAAAAGLDAATLESFVAAGMITPNADGSFRAPDIARARLVDALIGAGMTLETLADAAADGRLSLDYVELLMPQPVPLVAEPSDAERVLSYEPLVAPVLGTNRKPGEPIREDDLAFLELFAEAIALGAPEERVLRTIRTFAQAARHLVDLQREFVDEVLLGPAIEKTGSPVAALATTAEVRFAYRNVGRRLLGLLVERFVDEAVFKNLVQLTEKTLAAGEVSGAKGTDSIVFIDISSYTKRSEESGDAAAAHQGTLLATLAQELALAHGGRMVRALGDGAMAHFTSSTDAVQFALSAVDAAERRGVWTLHGGVNTGPMLQRDGDYFGTTVNVASRVADQAAPGTVMVTDRVVAAWGGGDSVVFEPMGEAVLKNVADPIPLLRADRR